LKVVSSVVRVMFCHMYHID